VFYDVFSKLCEEKGVSKKKAVTEAGLSNSLATKWKNTGATPSGETLSKLCAYFNVTADYLLGNQEKATIDSVDDDLKEYLEELRERPEMRMLFSTTKTATKAQIEAIVKMVEEMQGNK